MGLSRWRKSSSQFIRTLLCLIFYLAHLIWFISLNVVSDILLDPTIYGLFNHSPGLIKLQGCDHLMIFWKVTRSSRKTHSLALYDMSMPRLDKCIIISNLDLHARSMGCEMLPMGLVNTHMWCWSYIYDIRLLACMQCTIQQFQPVASVEYIWTTEL